jgi:hypothetical protein
MEIVSLGSGLIPLADLRKGEVGDGFNIMSRFEGFRQGS